ncbi:MAG: O-antigen ligase family protein [Pseudomonadales bacterium]
MSNSQACIGKGQLIIFLFCCLVLVFSPSVDMVPWDFNAYDEKRFLEILLVIAVLLHRTVNGQPIQGYGYGCLLVFLLFFVSSCFSFSPRYAFLEMALFVGLFFFVDFVKNAWLWNAGQTLNSVVVVVCLSACLFIFTFLLGYLAFFLEGIPLQGTAPFYHFYNVRFFNQYQLWLFPLLTIPLSLSSPIICKYKKMLFALLICWWVLLFLTAGRGALIAITAAILISLLMYRRACFYFVKIQMLAALFGFVVYTFLYYFVYASEAKTVLRSVGHGRLDLWGKAIELSIQNPFFGVGPMHYAGTSNDIANHPHNSVLQIAAEWGLPAALIILGLFFYGLICWLRRFNYQTVNEYQDEVKPQVVVALFCSLLAGAIYSLVSGVIVMPLSQIMGALVIGLMFGVYRGCDSEKTVLPVKIGRSYLVIKSNLSRFLAGITLVIFVWAVLPGLLPRVLDGQAFSAKSFQVNGGWTMPRFWADGEIPGQIAGVVK